jgi:hypothetical protein
MEGEPNSLREMRKAMIREISFCVLSTVNQFFAGSVDSRAHELKVVSGNI